MKKVKVIFPDGSTAELDESQVSGAIAAGAKRFTDNSVDATQKSTSMVFPDGSIADIPSNGIDGALKAGAIKKKGGSNGVVEESNGTPEQSVPTTSQLPLQDDISLPASFDLTFTKQPVVNIAGANVSIKAPIQDVSRIPEVANQQALTEQLQARINTKTYTPEDVDVVAKSMDVSLPVANAYMKGDIGTGTVMHFNDVKATKQNQLKQTVERANQELGLSDSYDEIFASPELAGAYINKIEALYQSKADQEAGASTKKAQKDNPTLFALGSIYVDKSQSRETLNSAQEIKNIISNDIIEKISEDNLLTTDQKVNKIYSLTDSRDKANVKKAIDQRLSPLRYMIDVATGGNTTEDIDLLNANKAGIEFKVNRTIGEKINYNEALKKSITEEYLSKVESEEISAENETAIQSYAKRIAAIDEENLELSQSVVPDKTLYDKYPVLYKSGIANAVNEFNAIKSGNVQGYEDGGYEGVTLNEHLAAQGFDVKDQKVQDFLDGDNFKDYSFFGRPLKNVVEVFTNTGKSLADITQLRDEADVLSEKRKAEMFPTQVGATDELKLTTSASTAQNISNTTGQVIGQGLLQAGTAGLGRMMGLTKVAANGAAFWTSGTLTSYDQAYKDSYDFVDSGVGRTAYAGLIALANGASERIFPEVKLFQIPGVQDALANVAKRVGTKEFTTELSNELLGKAKNAFVDYAVKYGKNIGQETVEEVATDLFESSTRFLFGDPNISAEKAIESAKNTAIQTAIGTSLIGGFGAHRDVQSERNVSAKSTIYNAAIYHDEALDAISLGFNENLYNEKERDAKIAVLNTAREAVNVMDKTEKIEGKTLKRPERELYVANLTAEAGLKGQKTGMDEVGQKAIDEKVSNLQNQRQQILKGEVLIDDNGNITTPTTKPVQSEEVTTEVQTTEATIPASTESVSETTTAAEPTILEPTEESGIVVQPPMFIPEPIIPDGTTTGIVVDRPRSFPEPITIGGEQTTTEPTVTPEVKTEPLPPTVESEAVKDIENKRNIAFANIHLVITDDGLTTDKSGNKASYKVITDENGKNTLKELWQLSGKSEQDLKDKINAKYDADLAALKSETKPTSQKNKPVESEEVKETPSENDPKLKGVIDDVNDNVLKLHNVLSKRQFAKEFEFDGVPKEGAERIKYLKYRNEYLDAVMTKLDLHEDAGKKDQWFDLMERVEDEYDSNIAELKASGEIKSENKPTQNEEAKATEVETKPSEVTQPTETPKVASFSTKARDLAAKIRKNGITPDFLKVSDPNVKISGIGDKQISEALATAIEFIADAVDLGTDLAKAISDGFDNFKKVYTDNNEPFDEPKIKEGFTGYANNIFRDDSGTIPPTGNTGTKNTNDEKPKMRSVYKNIIERSKLPEKQKKLLRDDPKALYEVLPNDKAKAIALQIVEEMGVENAVAEASRKTSDLEPFEKVMILGAAMDHYSGIAKKSAANNNEKDANRNADLEIDANDKMLQAAQQLAELGTSLGRGINMFNEVYKLSNIALERKLKKQIDELNKLNKPQTDASVSVITDIIKDDSVTGIGQGMTDAELQQMADLKSKVSALEKEIEDLKKQVAANANAPIGSKKNPLNIVRKTNTTEYAKRLKEFAQRHRTGLNKDDLSDLTYFGLYHIENGVTKFADWFGIMSRKFSKFKEYLRDTYISARDTSIDNGADATLFDNEDGIDNHLVDLQDKSDAKKMAQLTKRKAIAEANRLQENDPAKARIQAPRIAAERIRNDAARNLGLITTKNEQTYLKKLITTIQTKAREYYKEKKENISNVNDILAFAIANGKSDYAIWERTQKAVEEQIDADENLSDEEKEEVKGFLTDYTDSIFETLLTGKQQEEIIRQKLIDAGYSTEKTINGKVVKAVDWSKVIGTAKNIREAKAAIKKAILDVGFTEAEAQNEIDAVLNQFDNKVLEKKQTAINNYLKKGIINKVKGALGIGNNKTKIQKLVDMNNKGILDDSRVKEVLAKDLGIISLSDNDIKKIRELTTLIDNPKIPAFQKKKYEEQLQYLFDSKGGNLTYLEFREFLANNRLTSMYNNIQNLTGWFRAISTYITVAIKTGSPIKTAKVFNKAFNESVSDAMTILLHGDVSRGTAFADLTKSTEGEPRVRYLEQGKGKLLGLPDAYVRVGKKSINLNILNTLYKGVKFVARVLESADTVPSNVISGLTQYWQIRKQLQFLHPEMSSKQIEEKAYETMNSIGLAEATKEAIEGFNEAGITPSKYQLNRAKHEINERNRNELLSKEFYDRLEATKPIAEQRLIDNGNPKPTGEEITKEAYLILGRDEPLDVVARGERQALRETGKKSTFGLAGLLLMPLNALNKGLKKGMLANHTNAERWVINSGDAAITFLLPYANSIGRWIEMGIELTPYGVLKGLAYKSGAANLFEGIREGKITKEELSELGDDYIIRGVQGSAMLLSGMYLMSLLNAGDDDDDEEKTIDATGTYKNPSFPKEKIQSVGKPDQTLTVGGHKIPLGLIGNAAYPLIMYKDFLDKRTNDNEKHGILYTTAAVYIVTAAQSVDSRLGAYGSIIAGIQSGKEDRYLPQLGKVVGSNVGASFIPFNRLQQEVGQLWNPKSEQSLTFGENLLQQFSIVGALGKAHPSFDYRGREYDFGDVFTGSADGIVKMFEKSKRADKIDRKLAEIDFGATDAFRESKDEENYKYTITDKEGKSRFMTTTEYYDFRKATAQKFNEKITKNFDIVNDLSLETTDGAVDENLKKKIMNDTYSDMLTTAKEQALELVQAKTGFIPSNEGEARADKKENKFVQKQKKRQLKGLDYEN